MHDRVWGVRRITRYTRTEGTSDGTTMVPRRSTSSHPRASKITTDPRSKTSIESSPWATLNSALTTFVLRKGLPYRCVNIVGNLERSRFDADTRRDPAKTAVKLGAVKQRAITWSHFFQFSEKARQEREIRFSYTCLVFPLLPSSMINNVPVLFAESVASYSYEN